MNDFERKLSQQPFRAPPPDLREAILGAAQTPALVVEPTRWTWRDCFWPSPQAWAALAALWILFAALASRDGGAAGAPEPIRLAQWPAQPTLLSYYASRDLNYVLDTCR